MIKCCSGYNKMREYPFFYGVIADSNLSLNSHIKAATRSAFYHLTNIATLHVKNSFTLLFLAGLTTAMVFGQGSPKRPLKSFNLFKMQFLQRPKRQTTSPRSHYSAFLSATDLYYCLLHNVFVKSLSSVLPSLQQI